MGIAIEYLAIYQVYCFHFDSKPVPLCEDRAILQSTVIYKYLFQELSSELTTVKEDLNSKIEAHTRELKLVKAESESKAAELAEALTREKRLRGTHI